MLCFGANCPHIAVPSQESDKHHSIKRTIINFHVLKKVSRCMDHGRRTQEGEIVFFVLYIATNFNNYKTIHKKIACNYVSIYF